MRKTVAAPFAARKISQPAARRDDAPVELVCLALVLAIAALAARIISVW
jgi:hypothetical protein